MGPSDADSDRFFFFFACLSRIFPIQGYLRRPRGSASKQTHRSSRSTVMKVSTSGRLFKPFAKVLSRCKDDGLWIRHYLWQAFYFLLFKRTGRKWGRLISTIQAAQCPSRAADLNRSLSKIPVEVTAQYDMLPQSEQLMEKAAERKTKLPKHCCVDWGKYHYVGRGSHVRTINNHKLKTPPSAMNHSSSTNRYCVSPLKKWAWIPNNGSFKGGQGREAKCSIWFGK